MKVFMVLVGFFFFCNILSMVIYIICIIKMKKKEVWCVFELIWFDRWELIKIFDTEKKAKKYCEKDEHLIYSAEEIQ